MVEYAPVESLKPHDLGMKINVTKRVLSDDEIRVLYETFENTGMRRKNALLMQLIPVIRLPFWRDDTEQT